MSSYRYAIYYAPAPRSALWRLGSAWLGRDAVTGEDREPPRLEGVAPAEARAMTAAPARYGFHATLKPPFRPQPGTAEQDLMDALERFAAVHRPVPLPPLVVTSLGDFIALTPAGPAPGLCDLAAECVERLDGFRAPMEKTELAARRQAQLTRRQDALLERWGYPYVMDEFRFHLTLTGPLPSADRSRIRRALAACFEPVTAEPASIDALTLFGQPMRDAPFRVLKRFPFSGGD